ncbi:unnamed protein product, partial [Staurois parvus]
MMSASDILLTTIHVITDWPISDHMIRTTHRGSVQRSVFHCARITVPCAPRELAQAENAEVVYIWPPAPALPPFGRLCTWARREVV